MKTLNALLKKQTELREKIASLQEELKSLNAQIYRLQHPRSLKQISETADQRGQQILAAYRELKSYAKTAKQFNVSTSQAYNLVKAQERREKRKAS